MECEPAKSHPFVVHVDWVCKPAYLVPVRSQEKLGGCVREGIPRKNGGMAEMEAPINLDGVAANPDCWVCLPVLSSFCTRKSRRWRNVPSGTTHRVVADKVQRAVKWLCVCVCVCVCGPDAAFL